MLRITKREKQNQRREDNGICSNLVKENVSSNRNLFLNNESSCKNVFSNKSFSKRYLNKRTFNTKKSITILKRTTAALFVILTLAISYLPGTPSWDDIYAAVGLSSSPQNYNLSDLNVFFLDVGQGDSILIYTESTTILIDTGPECNEQTIYSLLKQLKVDHIDYLIITHQHSDHVGSLNALKQLIKIDNEIIPDSTSKMSGFSLTLDINKSVRDEAQNIESSLGNKNDSITLDFLGPIYLNEDLNNMSLVLKLTYKNTSFLLMGDAGKDEEGTLLRTYSAEELHADVLKVAHHGSESSSSQTFLQTVSPTYAVISVGEANDYGHPHKATLDTLNSLDIKTYRTDLDGTILFASNGEKISCFYNIRVL